MKKPDIEARLLAADVSKTEILSALETEQNHVVLFKALLAAARRDWDSAEPIVSNITSLFDRADGKERVAMGSSLRALVVFALGKLRHPAAPHEYLRLKPQLELTETDSLAWLERDAPADLADL